jgi:hypothetical protein
MVTQTTDSSLSNLREFCRQRITLFSGDLYTLPKSPITIQVVSGEAWISADTEDIILLTGEATTLMLANTPAVMSGFGSVPVTVDIIFPDRSQLPGWQKWQLNLKDLGTYSRLSRKYRQLQQKVLGSVMKTTEYPTYQTEQSFPLKHWWESLSRLIQSSFEKIISPELAIRESADRMGHKKWEVLDPQSGQVLSFYSDEEVMTWIEKHYYGNPF